MSDRPLPLTRRTLLASAAASGLSAIMPPTAAAQPARPLVLEAGLGNLALRPGQPDTKAATLSAPGHDGVPRLRRGEPLAVSFANALPGRALLNFRGANGAAAAEPLLARPPVVAGGRDAFTLPQRFAGTALCDLRLLEDATTGPLPVLPLVVAESEPVSVDRDEVMLIEEFRLAPDGRALAPGEAAPGAPALFTLNGKAAFDLAIRSHERLRLRFINGCQRSVVAIRIDLHDSRVMAVDGQPAEPFMARNGQFVLAPGTRIDSFVDATRAPESVADIMLHDGVAARRIGRLVYSGAPPLRAAALPAAPPLPSNGLPERIDLASAQRFDLPLAGADWTRAAAFAPTAPPAFRARRGRSMVLALRNPGDAPVVFHLHGHPFRLLDRMDDGWKPFWLDTLLIPPQQTERIAFLADQPGRWLIEAMAADWAAPRLLRSYAVE